MDAHRPRPSFRVRLGASGREDRSASARALEASAAARELQGAVDDVHARHAGEPADIVREALVRHPALRDRSLDEAAVETLVAFLAAGSRPRVDPMPSQERHLRP